jgi:alpha-glucosidase
MKKDLEKYLWWQKGIIYQIYPRSFYDTNEDGIGDLNGIREKLDYVKWLGVQAIWISPVFSSPMADFGYDISDYTGIHPMFGTMKDFDNLLEEAHRLDLKIILDLVPNHSSDQHPWFLESRSSRDNPKRNWYLWKDPGPNGGPPNNWLSVFRGSAWEYDSKTEQYYYHAFLKEQPDLNWRNPEVRQAMNDVMRYWLEKGVDGFRVDVIWHMIKDELYRDNPQNPDYNDDMTEYEKLIPSYSTDQPEVHDVIAEMRKVIDEFQDRLLIGEIYLPVKQLMAYYGNNGEGVHLPYNFQMLSVPWKLKDVYALINQYEGNLPPNGWPNWVLGNHDNPRIMKKLGEQDAKIATVLLLTLRGTPTIYYGDELGMQDVEIEPEKYQDPQGTRGGRSRDPQRTPMQWNDQPNAGFSTVEPWLPVSPDYREKNVEKEKLDNRSMLAFYKQLIDLRNNEPALQAGDYIPVSESDGMMVYKRQLGEYELIVCINWEKNNKSLKELNLSGTIVFASEQHQVKKPFVDDLLLGGKEVLIIKKKN